MHELIIVRHGEATHLTDALTGGWTDSRLTGLGKRQAERTGDRLAELLAGRPFCFYSSDLRRAVETARLIEQRLGVPPTFASELRELNLGIVANMTIEEARKHELPITRPVLDWVPFPRAESWRQMWERVCAFLDGIAADADTVLVITHGLIAGAIVHWRLDLGEAAWEKVDFALDPCAITRLTINQWGQRTIFKLNDTAHLSALSADE
jgi:broad specificity phosphatase PhoE